jgi:hypothetical protein
MRIVARSTSHSGMSTLSQPSVEHRIEGTARSGVNSASAADSCPNSSFGIRIVGNSIRAVQAVAAVDAQRSGKL